MMLCCYFFKKVLGFLIQTSLIDPARAKLLLSEIYISQSSPDFLPVEVSVYLVEGHRE